MFIRCLICGIFGFLMVSQVLGEPTGSTDLAEQILEASGIKAGLCVHLECGDGKLTRSFAASDKFIIHGLSSNRTAVSKTREFLISEAVYGRVSVDYAPLNKLPYHNNLVNLIFNENLVGLLSKGMTLQEINRVLCPGGVACLGLKDTDRKSIEAKLAEAGIKDFKFEERSGLWLILKKPYPAGMDEWTHWNHAPDGNLVSQDHLIATPKSVQWIAGPTVGHHDRVTTRSMTGRVTSWVSANGRNFYIMGLDYPISLAGVRTYRAMSLVARDAFNGTLLWTKPITGVQRRGLVAVGNRVYIAPGSNVNPSSDIQALDAATGELLLTYKAKPYSISYYKNILIAFENGKITAFDASSGKEKWSMAVSPKNYHTFFRFAPSFRIGAVIDEDKLFLMGRYSELSCIDIADGRVRWTRDISEWFDIRKSHLRFVKGGIILFRRDEDKEIIFHAFSSKDGEWLWSHKQENRGQNYRDDNGTFADGLVWVYRYPEKAGMVKNCVYEGLDPTTGQVKRSFSIPPMVFARCHQMQTTERFIAGNRPFFFINRKDGKIDRFEGITGSCGIGIGLANGLVYGLRSGIPNVCRCNQAALKALAAFSSDDKTENGEVPVEEEGRLEKGLAAMSTKRVVSNHSENWPMYRHDPQRSSATTIEVPADLALIWEQKLLKAKAPICAIENDWLIKRIFPDKLTGATIAEGKVFVSLTDQHKLVALDEKTGEIAWSYVTGGRLDTPPTIHNGLCLLGCHDGWVYCLRSKDGELVWRFRVAPTDRRIVASSQVESNWPVIGGVLVENNLAYAVAGLTSAADGGVHVAALEPRTGKLVWYEQRIISKQETWGRVRNSFSGFADLLSSDGKNIAIGGSHSPKGLLAPATGKQARQPFQTLRINLLWRRYGNSVTVPLAYHENTLFCGGIRLLKPHYMGQASKANSLGYLPPDLFARKINSPRSDPHLWKVEVPAPNRVEAIVKAGDKVLAAISYNKADQAGGEIWILSAKNGAKVGEYKLDIAPVFEGLSVANGRVYVALQDGTIVCLGKK